MYGMDKFWGVLIDNKPVWFPTRDRAEDYFKHTRYLSPTWSLQLVEVKVLCTYPFKEQCMYPYPSELPTQDCLNLVIKAIKGVSDVKESAHAVWVCLGYGLKQWDPHVLQAQPTLNTSDLVAVLEKGEGLGAIPWQILVPILVEILQKLLKK